MAMKKTLCWMLLALTLGAIVACDNTRFDTTTTTSRSDSTSTTTTSTTTSPVLPSDCDIEPTLSGGWVLWFCEDFAGDQLNREIWTPSNHVRHGSTQVFYADRPENLRVADGKLIFTAAKTPSEDLWKFDGMPYTSARVETKGKLDFTYGRIVVVAKTAAGAGTWPAIWMLPSTNVYGGWPRSGEIDIMEYYGKKPGVVSAAYHTEKYNHMNTNIATIARNKVVADAAETFHRYELIWTADSLTWLVDGEVLHFYRYNNRLEAQNTSSAAAWPFDQPFHLILNLGLGDAGGGGAGPIDELALPTTFEIESVKIYRLDHESFDRESPTAPNYVELSNWNDRYVLWPRSSDDLGVAYYEIAIDGIVVGRSSVNSYLFPNTDYRNAQTLSVRAVDHAGNVSPWVDYDLSGESE
jgi:beta-glucanase (GH16 family)